MADCMYEWSEVDILSLCQGVVWAGFTICWLFLGVIIPRPTVLGMDLFIAFIGLANASAGFLLAFITVNCAWELSYEQLIALFATLANAMFTMLQLFISRGFGLTRFSLSLTEKVAFVVVSLGLMIALVFPLMGLLYLVIYVLFIIYACRTGSLLSTQFGGEEMRKMLRKKQQIFTSIILLVVAGVCLSVVLGLMELNDNNDRYYRNGCIAVSCGIQVLFALELLLLHTYRNNPRFYEPVVSTDEVYLFRPSIIAARPEQGDYGALPPQYQAPVQIIYPQSMPSAPPDDRYLPITGPIIDRRY